tara:strand:+ start:1761 stop:3866 length:2106 start_codon:yes stop_codon:yes gene_type:complete
MAGFKAGGQKYLKELSTKFSEFNKRNKKGGKTVKTGFKMATRKLDNLIGVTKMGQATFGEALALQEKALSRGTNLGGLLEQSADNISNLEQGFTGYGNAVAIAADAFDAGLNTNNKALGTLLLQNKLTEKGSKQLAKTIRANTIGLGINDEGITHLAKTTQRLQQTYGVTSAELQSAISALGQRLADFGALGIGAEASEAAMQMGALIGKGGEKMGAEILAAVTAGDKLGQMSALGVSKSRQKFLKGEGDTMKNGIDLMLDVAIQSGKVVDKWTKDSKAPMLMLDAANKTYGGIITKGEKMRKALMEKYGTLDRENIMMQIDLERKNQKINEDFTKTWDNVKSKIVGPLKKLLTGWVKQLIEWSANPLFADMVKYLGIAAGALGIINIFGPWLAPLKLIGKGLFQVAAQLVIMIVKMVVMIALMVKNLAVGAAKGAMRGIKAVGTASRAAKSGGVGLMKTIVGGLGKAIKVGLMLIPKMLMAIPVFGWILAAILGIVALVVAFKKEIGEFIQPLIDFFEPVYNFFVHGIYKIKRAFSTGLWDGIKAIGNMLLGIPIGIWRYLQKLYYKLMAGITLWWNNQKKTETSDRYLKLAAQLAQEDKAARISEDAERNKYYKDQEDLKNLQTKELTAKAKERAAAEAALLKQGTANELLSRINKNMDLAEIRREYAQNLLEKQQKAAAETAENTKNKVKNGQMSSKG